MPDWKDIAARAWDELTLRVRRSRSLPDMEIQLDELSFLRVRVTAKHYRGHWFISRVYFDAYCNGRWVSNAYAESRKQFITLVEKAAVALRERTDGAILEALKLEQDEQGYGCLPF